MVFNLMKWILAHALFASFKKNKCMKNIPMFFDNLFSTIFMWYFQETFSTSITPNNFMDGVFCITLFPILSVVNFKGILSLIEYL